MGALYGADLPAPPTTVRQPVEERAAAMARLPDDHIKGARTEPTSVISGPEPAAREPAQQPRGPRQRGAPRCGPGGPGRVRVGERSGAVAGTTALSCSLPCRAPRQLSGTDGVRSAPGGDRRGGQDYEPAVPRRVLPPEAGNAVGAGVPGSRSPSAPLLRESSSERCLPGGYRCG